MLDVEIKTEVDFDSTSIVPVRKTFLQKRYDFFQRYQKSNETIYTYLEVVRDLAGCCRFHKNEKKLLVRDRLVSGLKDRNLQLKVIETYENPTIEDVLSICINRNDYVAVEDKVENTNNDMIVLKIIDEDKDEIYESSDNNANDIDVNIKEEPNDQIDDYVKMEDVNSTKEDRTDPSRGLTNQFKKQGWAYPRCSVCGKSFDDFKYLKGHLVEHAVKKNSNKTDQSEGSGSCAETNCVLCKRNFESHHELVLHYAVHTFSKLSLPKVNCSICKKLTAIRYLKKHMYQHIDEREFPCTLCDKKLKSPYHLKAHLKIHKEHKTHICDICGNKFLRKIYLENHKRRAHAALDAKIQVLECYLCKQRYKSLATLKTHIYWHSLPKNHLCTQCGERFRVISLLKRHLMRADHNGNDNKKFQCEICKSKFYDKTQYVNHRVVHTKERPYSCTYENCDKSYTTSKSLREHKRLHTGERPYHCNFCEYECINSTYLKRHMLVHTGRHK